MLVDNGHVDDNLKLLGLDEPQAERAKVWRNRGNGTFAFVADPGPYFATPHVARGAAFGDLDDDGDTDAVISRLDAKPAVLANESERGRWVRLVLEGTRSNRSAIGAVVEITAGGRTLVRQVKGGGSYMSSNDPRLLVGLGTAAVVDRVEVRWPSGSRSTLTGLDVDRAHRVREPEEPPDLAARRLGGSNGVTP
jgi:hypothetical protein